jgi:hypothetical protein
MESQGASNAPGVFRLAEDEHLDVAVSEDADVVMLKFSPDYGILLNCIKADSDRVARTGRNRLKRKIVK